MPFFLLFVLIDNYGTLRFFWLTLYGYFKRYSKRCNDMFFGITYGPRMKRLLLIKNRITHSLHARMKEQKSMLFLKVFSLKNLINEYILSHLFPRNTKIQMNAVDLESMFYGGSVN